LSCSYTDEGYRSTYNLLDLDRVLLAEPLHGLLRGEVPLVDNQESFLLSLVRDTLQFYLLRLNLKVGGMILLIISDRSYLLATA
jgi:hypothetical protein